MTNPDSIPRYAEPTLGELMEQDWDEILTCENCDHCFPLTDAQAKHVCSRLNPYGNWHRYDREVKNAVRNAMKCFGVCEVEGGLVDLAQPTCDHFGGDGE